MYYVEIIATHDKKFNLLLQDSIKKQLRGYMLEKLKKIDEGLPVIFGIDLAYLVIGEIIIVLFAQDKLYSAIGFFAGVLYAMFWAVHVKLGLYKTAHKKRSASKVLVVGYTIRIIVIIALFVVLYAFHLGSLFCATVGIFALTLSVYIQLISSSRKQA